MLTQKEESILSSIRVPSDDDPNSPEFPPDNPKFPATPTYKIEVPGFTKVCIKDESINPTGTHKDRMAWEIVVTYRDFLISKKKNTLKGDLPQMSLITSGNAAVAIQNMLNKYSLPPLKTLVDVNISSKMARTLRSLGCEVYQTELSRRPLNSKDILALTYNNDGFDITLNDALDPTTRFYDWMSYEIINASPDYVFIPFGTGNLYENILNINKKEISSKINDRRFSGDLEKLRRCNFIGATTHNPKSKADKLYSHNMPFLHFDEQWIRFYKTAGFCGPKSDVHPIKEEFLDKALKIAEKNKIECEPSGIAGLALLLQIKNNIARNANILIVNTGKLKVPEAD